jgi:hypothetical protein
MTFPITRIVALAAFVVNQGLDRFAYRRHTKSVNWIIHKHGKDTCR